MKRLSAIVMAMARRMALAACGGGTASGRVYWLNFKSELDETAQKLAGSIVNPDLVERAGHSMDELKNFEGLRAVAHGIHARAAALGFDAFSACDMGDSSSWRFTGHMTNPMLKPAMISVGILEIMWVWSDYYYTRRSL